MKLVRVISKSRGGNRMEVIAKNDDGLKTLHIHRKNRVWKYVAGRTREDKPFLLPITVEGRK